MSAQDWLHRLDSATDYATLQEIFGAIAADVESRPHDTQLAERIDEAIRRLTGERARDESELSNVQAQYESFKEDNRGFVGWFKRHLPFTATRRQELEHRTEVADQEAEILADNLVIARAQMLKERLLPGERRRLGLRVTDWEKQWSLQRTQAASAAKLLIQLRAEVEQSLAFYQELHRDIEAFAGASFREATDRQRKDADLAAARNDLGTLKHEIDAEKSLQQTGLKWLTDQVASELATTDPQFRLDGQHIEKLQFHLAHLGTSQSNMAKLLASVAQIGGLTKQLSSWPEQLQQARQALARLDSERATTTQASLAKSNQIQEKQSQLAEAQRAAEQAAQLVASLKSAYDAHLAQRSAQSSMPQAVEVEPQAPIVQQYQMATGVAQQAQARVREATSALDSVRREVAQCESAAKAAADKLADEQRKMSELEKKEPQMRSELAGHVDRGRREFAEAAATLATFLQADHAVSNLPAFRPEEIAAGTFGWLGPRGMELSLANSLFSSSQDVSRQVQAASVLDRLNQWQTAQKEALEQDLNQARGRRETLWKRRCRELLGEALAEQACSAGLAVQR